MIVAALNLRSECWQLAKLVVALLQPALVMFLIAGFVLASAHLLTMIATRWGNRRASSKSMFFSVAVHLILACGLVALIPEYRSRVFANLLEPDQEPIRILTVEDRPETLVSDHDDGNTSLFDRIPQTPTREWTRFHAAPDLPSSESPLDKPSESLPAPDRLAPDAAVLPPPEPVVPNQQQPEDTGALAAAAPPMTLEEVPVDSRPETRIASSTRERSEMPQAVRNDPQAPSRPDQGSVERLSPESSPDRRAPELDERPMPEAVVPEGSDTELTRRQGPAPAAPQPDRLGRSSDSPPVRSRAASPVDPQIARVESRTPLPASDSSPSVPQRPRLESSPPDGIPERSDANQATSELAIPEPIERPQLARSDDPFMKRTEEDRVPSAYRLRTEEERELAILKFGGSKETEAAVDRSLKWLASVQSSDGSWDASSFGAREMGVGQNRVSRQDLNRDSQADTGVTALAVLAFLGKLNTVDQGEYSPVVNRALRWIISQQHTRQWGDNWGTTRGYLGGAASEFEGTYCHAMATFALGEAYAMSRENPDAQWLREPLELAVAYIVDTQISDGGWRYIKGQPDGDMSIFGWQLMALKSAETAGIPVPLNTKARMIRFLNDRRMGRSGGLASYRRIRGSDGDLTPPTPAMTAEALYCRQMLGLADDQAATREAVAFLLENTPARSSLNYYYWYYGTLALYQQGGPEWETWNGAVRDLLVSEQLQTGPFAGSWEPHDMWGAYGGRIYATAIATLNLEVYYRYLPLYRTR